MKKGDRVRYIGYDVKYKNWVGTVTRTGQGGGAFARMYTVVFDNGVEGVFFDEADFMEQPAVDELARLTRFLPTEADIGRGVVYTPAHGPAEDGVITSINDSFVFVRYKKQHPSAPGQATSREDLRWLA